ncbi:MAG: membrane protein insertion efficiency factor YidD [Spirochaetales bacterium]|nr:membrane protein insertion efficiency factor YidD [Spirochaetales bacterium]
MLLSRIVRFLWVAPLYGYKKLISPLIPKRCIYYPSCSSYGIESVLRFGVVRGTLLSAARVFRCHGLFQGGFDPVPRFFTFKRVYMNYKIFYPRKKKTTHSSNSGRKIN